MRGFIFTIDMVYGAIIVILLFSLLVHASKPSFAPQQQILQIQAKDAVVEWFYSSPDADGALPSTCGSLFKPCACDIGFRPRVTTVPLDPFVPSDWVEQMVCVGSP